MKATIRNGDDSSLGAVGTLLQISWYALWYTTGVMMAHKEPQGGHGH